MSDKPKNPGDPDDSKRWDAPKPEQIWPPPDSSKEPVHQHAGEPVELEWSDKIDAAAKRGSESIATQSQASSSSSWSRGGGTALACEVNPSAIGELGQLWSNIFFAVGSPAPKAVVVCGARRRDGATHIATGLAMTGAEANRELRIALIDFNLRHPAIGELLGVSKGAGLAGILNGTTDLDAATQHVQLRNGNHLDVIPAGSLVDQPLGMIKSRQVQSLMAQILDRYDHAILDVAAANMYPDAQVLSSLVDGAVLVAKAGDTPKETIAEAKKRLDLAGVRCLGLVLNQRTDPIPGLVYRMT